MTVPAQPRKFYSLRKGEIQENGFGQMTDAQKKFYEIQRSGKDDQTRYKLWQYNKDEFDRQFQDEGRFYAIERKDQRVVRVDNPDYKVYAISKPMGWKPPEPTKKELLAQKQPRLYAIQRADRPREISERIIEYRRQTPTMMEPRMISPEREPVIRIMTPPKRIPTPPRRLATPPRRIPTPRLLSPIFTRKPSPPIYVKPPSPIIVSGPQPSRAEFLRMSLIEYLLFSQTTESRGRSLHRRESQ